MDIDFSEAADINVEVQALNLEGIKQNLLDYVQDQAKIDIADSVDKADKSAQSAKTYAGEAAISATTASECAEQTSENLGLYYKKSETDALLDAKAAKATSLAGYGITDAYTKTQIDTSLSGKASTSLDNLSSAGQMIVDSQNGTISNCILEIPQNIHLTLENNVLTLKAGSIVTLANGSTYTTYTTTQDYSTTIPDTRPDEIVVMTFVVGQGFWDNNIPITETYSGATAPSTTYPHAIWFDTTTTKIMNWSVFQQDWQSLAISYPICNIDIKNGVASFAKDSNGNDMIFNGACFIGHHAVVYPNVRGLYANRFNADGSLASGFITNNSLVILEMATGQAYTGYNRCIGLSDSSTDGIWKWRGYKEVDTPSDLTTQDYMRQYVKSTNKIEVYTGSSYLSDAQGYYRSVKFIEYNYNGSTVTDFTIRQPVRTATVEMLDKALGNVETLLAAI